MTVEILKAEKGNILSNPSVNNDSIGLESTTNVQQLHEQLNSAAS